MTLGEIEEADAKVGADDVEAAVAIFDVVRRCFERVGSERLRMLDGALGRDLHRRAAGEQRARPGAAEAVGAIGVALQHANAVDADAEHVDRELCVARCDALAHRLRRRGELDDPFRQHVDRDLLGQRIAAGPLEKRRYAAPAQLAALG